MSSNLAALGLAFTLAAPAPEGEPARPNVLILVADDLGYADVGFNGGKTIATPNLDRLAASGVQFTDFRACPICSPTRAGLLTGRWPLRFGLMRAVVPPWSQYGLPPEEDTLPELLAPAGYVRRGLVGKWHLGHARREFLPESQGFTHFVGHYNGAIDYFTQLRDGERDWHAGMSALREEGYTTDLIAEHAVRFIEGSPEEPPWFLCVAFNAPHAPYEAKPAELEKYAHVSPPEQRVYAAMVDSLDQAVGRILSAVEKRSETDDTLVLFFSDNGAVPRRGSNAPFRGAKLNVYEGGTRVCAALRWPGGGIAGGKRFDGRAGYIDVLPTVLAAAGVAAPDDLDGLDLLPALKAGAALPERPWFSYIDQDGGAHASVHLGQWKLVAHGDFFAERPASAPTLELYDLAADPAESNNLAARQVERVTQLHRRLRAFGALQKSGVGAYDEGRAGFVAPKDWQVPR